MNLLGSRFSWIQGTIWDYGVISRIIPAGSNEIYVVGTGEKAIFLPATHEVVQEIDLEMGKMTVSAMEGLLNLNEV